MDKINIGGKQRIFKGRGDFRFLERHGKKILQYMAEYTEMENGRITSIGMDWIDVPLVFEDTNPASNRLPE